MDDDLIQKAAAVIHQAQLDAPRTRGMGDSVSPFIARALAQAGMLRAPAPSAAEFSSSESAEQVLGELHHLAIDGVATASIRELAELTGLGRSTVNRALRRLAAQDRISPARKGTGDGFPTSWRLTDPKPDASTE